MLAFFLPHPMLRQWSPRCWLLWRLAPSSVPSLLPSRFGFHNNPRRWEAVNWQVMPSLGGGHENPRMLDCDLSLTRFPAPLHLLLNWMGCQRETW